jgi:hypothetical protein
MDYSFWKFRTREGFCAGAAATFLRSAMATQLLYRLPTHSNPHFVFSVVNFEQLDCRRVFDFVSLHFISSLFVVSTQLDPQSLAFRNTHFKTKFPRNRRSISSHTKLGNFPSFYVRTSLISVKILDPIPRDAKVIGSNLISDIIKKYRPGKSCSRSKHQTDHDNRCTDRFLAYRKSE